MKYIQQRIPDLLLMEPRVFGDLRGFFMETWRQDEFRAKTDYCDFVQDNHSMSGQGILRGLHYQIQHPQGKLVRVVSGTVFDVAVDIRKSSPYFGQWVGIILSDENRHMLWIPPGFAHGFYVLSDQAEFIYRCTDYYAPEHERSILWNDPDLSIDWPLLPGIPPLLSDKDKNGIAFKNAEVFS